MQDGEAHSNPFKLSHFQAEIEYGCSELNKHKPCPTFVISSCLAWFLYTAQNSIWTLKQ